MVLQALAHLNGDPVMLVIIGCGNPNRSDDGAGIAVVRKLLEHYREGVPTSVRIFDAGTDGMAVMFMARGATSLIIADASATGGEPGAIYKVPGEELEGKPPDSHTLHDFRWDHALYAGKQIFRENFPRDVSVYLIEASSLALGLELSEPVAASADRVADMIRTRIDSYAADQ
jgi:hydrogenase maturation protease